AFGTAGARGAGARALLEPEPRGPGPGLAPATRLVVSPFPALPRNGRPDLRQLPLAVGPLRGAQRTAWMGDRAAQLRREACGHRALAREALAPDTACRLLDPHPQPAARGVPQAVAAAAAGGAPVAHHPGAHAVRQHSAR